MTYYTPSIDEFHHNMMYEELIDNEWKPLKFKLKLIPDILKTRIRYLDEGDIMELGFRLERTTRHGSSFIKEIQSIRTIEFVELQFVKHNGEPYVSLFQNEEIIFSEVNVKNIYELKWLLNRYGVV